MPSFWATRQLSGSTRVLLSGNRGGGTEWRAFLYALDVSHALGVLVHVYPFVVHSLLAEEALDELAVGAPFGAEYCYLFKPHDCHYLVLICVSILFAGMPPAKLPCEACLAYYGCGASR